MRIRAMLMTALACAGVAMLVAACPPSGAPQPVPPSPSPSSGWQQGGGGSGNEKLADGGRCSTAADCVSGVCEGKGCGFGEGTCVPTQRICTKDLREYCGCDGKTFSGSGPCPGRRYAHAGACQLADGAACQQASDCTSGICEGQGCGPDTPGVCVSKQRVCAAVMTSFCGCDGKTFQSGSSCANRRYAATGACAAATPRADGESCLAGTECASGVCEGEGCEDDKPGKCAPARRACTKDLRAYCGCDGQTFRGSGSCPGRRFRSRSECAAP